MFYDRINQNSSTTGTGTFTLTTALQGYQTFSVVGNGSQTYYAATDSSGQWEVGQGVYNSETLTRIAVLSSSNDNILVNFGEGVTVFQPCPAIICNQIGQVGGNNGNLLWKMILI